MGRMIYMTIPTVRHGREYSAKVYRNAYGEYVARLYVNGKAYLPADYYGSDIEDASYTANDMVRTGQ